MTRRAAVAIAAVAALAILAALGLAARATRTTGAAQAVPPLVPTGAAPAALPPPPCLTGAGGPAAAVARSPFSAGRLDPAALVEITAQAFALARRAERAGPVPQRMGTDASVPRCSATPAAPTRPS